MYIPNPNEAKRDDGVDSQSTTHGQFSPTSNSGAGEKGESSTEASPLEALVELSEIIRILQSDSTTARDEFQQELDNARNNLEQEIKDCDTRASHMDNAIAALGKGGEPEMIADTLNARDKKYMVSGVGTKAVSPDTITYYLDEERTIRIDHGRKTHWLPSGKRSIADGVTSYRAVRFGVIIDHSNGDTEHRVDPSLSAWGDFGPPTPPSLFAFTTST